MAARCVERAAAVVADVHGHSLDLGAGHGTGPREPLAAHRGVVGIGLVVHVAGHVELTGALVEHQAIDAQVGAEQPRRAGQCAERLRLVPHGRGLHLQGHVGHVGGTPDTAGKRQPADDGRHRRARGTQRHEELREADGRLERAVEPARHHPHPHVTRHVRACGVERERRSAERIFVVHEIGAGRGPRARGQHQIARLDAARHARAVERAAERERAVRRALQVHERGRHADPRAPGRADGRADIGDLEGHRARDGRPRQVAAGVPLRRAVGTCAVEQPVVVPHDPAVVCQRGVPCTAERHAIRTCEWCALPGGPQAHGRLRCLAPQRDRALLPRGDRQGRLIVERQSRIEVEITKRPAQVERSGITELVGESPIEHATPRRAALRRRGDGEGLDHGARRRQRQPAGQGQAGHAGNRHRAGAKRGAQFVSAERPLERAVERAGAADRHGRRRPCCDGREVECAGKRQREAHVVEHAIDAAVSHDRAFRERRRELLQRHVRSVEGDSSLHRAARRGVTGDTRRNRRRGQGAARAREDADVALGERGAQIPHGHVDVAGAIVVVHIEPTDLQSTHVEAPGRVGHRLARRRRQVHEHAALAHEQHPRALDLERRQTHLAAHNRPGQRDRHVTGSEERRVRVSGHCQAHVVDRHPACEQVQVEAAGGQVELPTLGHLPYDPIAAPAGSRARMDGRNRCPDERGCGRDRPGEPAWDTQPHLLIIRAPSCRNPWGNRGVEAGRI